LEAHQKEVGEFMQRRFSDLIKPIPMDSIGELGDLLSKDSPSRDQKPDMLAVCHAIAAKFRHGPKAALSFMALTRNVKQFAPLIYQQALENKLEFFAELGRAVSGRWKGSPVFDKIDWTILENHKECPACGVVGLGLEDFTDYAASILVSHLAKRPELHGNAAMYRGRRRRLGLRPGSTRGVIREVRISPAGQIHLDR
jgi:hypothetical protein